MNRRLRVALPSDAEALAGIYAPIVRDTAISFEVEVPTAAELERRVAGVIEQAPWLVAEQAGRVQGYAYAGPHRSRAAYAWSADVSVYVDGESRRSGVGRALYRALFAILAGQGYHRAYAGITLPNAGSVALHESLGFECIGRYREVGWKLGHWHDVGWWELALAAGATAPAPPIPFATWRASAAGRRALEAATATG